MGNDMITARRGERVVGGLFLSVCLSVCLAD